MTSNSRVLVVLGVLIGLTGLGELVWAVLAHHPSGGANIGAGIAALGALAGLVAFASGILLGWLPPTTSGGEAVVLVVGFGAVAGGLFSVTLPLWCVFSSSSC
jgi:hypothetical protein